jgi:hypothetical protein
MAGDREHEKERNDIEPAIPDRDASADMRKIQYGEYTWEEFERDTYSVDDPDGRLIALIFPGNQSLPLESGANAVLSTRDFGSGELKTDETHIRLEEALSKGTKHIDRYRAEYYAARLIEEARAKGASPETLALIENANRKSAERRLAAERSETEKASDAPARAVWDHIRKAAQRRQEEKTRNKDRDGGRERD